MSALDEIRITFFLECEEQLAALESGLLRLESGERDPELINEVFRSVHSIKGGAGAFSLDDLVSFAHTFETVLDEMRGNRLEATPDVVHTMLRAADTLSDIVSACRDGREIESQSRDVSLAALRALLGAGPDPREEEVIDFQPLVLDLDFPIAQDADRYRIVFTPNARSLERGNEPVLLLRALSKLGTVTAQVSREAVPSLPDFEPGRPTLSWSLELSTSEPETAIHDVFDFVNGDSEVVIEKCEAPTPAETAETAQASEEATSEIREQAHAPKTNAPAEPPRAAGPERPAAAPGAGAESVATIRVDLERIDRLINLVGELVINQAMLSQRVNEAGISDSSSVVAGLVSLEQLTRELQESVMAIRAQPVKTLFQRMSRIVREVADATGKSVQLQTDGDSTEVDRTVIERIADPLTHMIRNAVDHGLEKPEQRAAAGKSPQGIVRLSAAHRSGRILIEVADDGGGINREHVKKTAIRKGLIPEDVQLSDSEIDGLLFLPGFSTAESVSNISGRGVGMDVVKRSIHALGGRITIASEPGKGTTFSMSLPLTLAILDGMVVKVGSETLVVPITAIIETLRPKNSTVHTMGPKSLVLADRGGFVPVIDVGRELGYRHEDCDPQTSVALLVETEAGRRCALLVDTIVDQRQVVIKSLTANYRNVPGIAAATILGDGRVALIVDVDAFIARTSKRNAHQIQALAS